jgi:hypothetical protein
MATRKAVKKGSSTIFWIIGGIIVVAGGIGAYFLLRKPKEEGQNDTDTDTDDDINNNLGRNNQGGGNIIRYTAPKELNSKDKIESFQNYVVNVKKDKFILGNAGVDGIWGKNSQRAFDKYGKDYLASLKAGSPATSPATSPTTSPEMPPFTSPTTSLSADINTIINFSTGTKAEKTFLQKTNADFVRTWAKAVRDKKRAFIWANQVYRTRTGVRVLEYNPFKVVFYSRIKGQIAKLTPNDSARALAVQKGVNLGMAKGIDFNDGLWLYLPDTNRSSNYKWYKITNVTRTQSSSFEGITDEIEFENFDNNLDLNF